MEALPYIIQIAFFGAAGSSFVMAHLKNLAASDQGDRSATEKWRFFRHPHKRPGETREQLLLRRAAALQTAWGYCFLGGALATPLVFRALHIGA
ncbi:MAG: hypothetical protein NW200_00495 [Hyphomonadaceae bacterium]|nr:hypothetical protein [Hyphomonadaceae bacterium]